MPRLDPPYAPATSANGHLEVLENLVTELSTGKIAQIDSTILKSIEGSWISDRLRELFLILGYTHLILIDDIDPSTEKDISICGQYLLQYQTSFSESESESESEYIHIQEEIQNSLYPLQDLRKQQNITSIKEELKTKLKKTINEISEDQEIFQTHIDNFTKLQSETLTDSSLILEKIDPIIQDWKTIVDRRHTLNTLYPTALAVLAQGHFLDLQTLQAEFSIEEKEISGELITRLNNINQSWVRERLQELLLLERTQYLLQHAASPALDVHITAWSNCLSSQTKEVIPTIEAIRYETQRITKPLSRLPIFIKFPDNTLSTHNIQTLQNQFTDIIKGALNDIEQESPLQEFLLDNTDFQKVRALVNHWAKLSERRDHLESLCIKIQALIPNQQIASKEIETPQNSEDQRPVTPTTPLSLPTTTPENPNRTGLFTPPYRGRGSSFSRPPSSSHRRASMRFGIDHKLEEERLRINQLTQDLEVAQTEKEELRRENTQFKYRMDEQNETISKYEETMAIDKGKIAELQEKIQALNHKLSTTQRELRKSDTWRTDYETININKDKDIIKLGEELQQYKTETKRLTLEVKDCLEILTKIPGVDNSADLTTAIQKLSQDHQKLSQAYRKLSQDYQKALDTIKTYHSEKEGLIKAFKENTIQTDKIEEKLALALLEQQTIEKNLQAALKEKQVLSDALETTKKEYEQTKTELEELRIQPNAQLTDIGTLQEEKRELASRITALESEIQEKNTEISRLEQALIKESEHNSNIQTTLSNTQATLDQTTSQLNSLQADLDEAYAELASAKSQQITDNASLEKLQEKIQGLETTTIQKQEALSDAQQRIETLEKDLNQAREQAEKHSTYQTQALSKNLQAQLIALEAAAKGINNRIQKQSNQSINDLKALEQTTTKKNEENNQLAEKLHSLETQQSHQNPTNNLAQPNQHEHTEKCFIDILFTPFLETTKQLKEEIHKLKEERKQLGIQLTEFKEQCEKEIHQCIDNAIKLNNNEGINNMATKKTITMDVDAAIPFPDNQPSPQSSNQIQQEFIKKEINALKTNESYLDEERNSLYMDPNFNEKSIEEIDKLFQQKEKVHKRRRTLERKLETLNNVNCDLESEDEAINNAQPGQISRESTSSSIFSRAHKHKRDDSWVTDVTSYTSPDEENASIGSDIGQANAQINSGGLYKKNQKTTTENLELNEQSSALREQIEDLHAQIAELEIRQGQTDTKIDTHTTEIDTHTGKINELKKELFTLQIQPEMEPSSLLPNSSEIFILLGELKAQITELQSRSQPEVTQLQKPEDSLKLKAIKEITDSVVDGLKGCFTTIQEGSNKHLEQSLQQIKQTVNTHHDTLLPYLETQQQNIQDLQGKIAKLKGLPEQTTHHIERNNNTMPSINPGESLLNARLTLPTAKNISTQESDSIIINNSSPIDNLPEDSFSLLGKLVIWIQENTRHLTTKLASHGYELLEKRFFALLESQDGNLSSTAAACKEKLIHLEKKLSNLLNDNNRQTPAISTDFLPTQNSEKKQTKKTTSTQNKKLEPAYQIYDLFKKNKSNLNLDSHQLKIENDQNKPNLTFHLLMKNTSQKTSTGFFPSSKKGGKPAPIQADHESALLKLLPIIIEQAEYHPGATITIDPSPLAQEFLGFLSAYIQLYKSLFGEDSLNLKIEASHPLEKPAAEEIKEKRKIILGDEGTRLFNHDAKLDNSRMLTFPSHAI